MRSSLEGWGDDSDSEEEEESDGEVGRKSRASVFLRACGLVGGALLAGLLAARVLSSRGGGAAVHSRGYEPAGTTGQPLLGVSLAPSEHLLPGVEVGAPAPRAAAPPADVARGPESTFRPSSPTVVFSLVVESMDYARLLAHGNILATFRATVKQTVASVVGMGLAPEDIELLLSPGSVNVECRIAVASGEEASLVQEQLLESSRLRGDLDLELKVLARIAAMEGISTGRVAVGSISLPVVLGTTTAAPTLFPPTSTTVTTTTRTPRPPPPCGGMNAICVMNSQCCSHRCSAGGRCAKAISWR